MKNLINTFILKKSKVKKTISKMVIFAFLVNMISPGLLGITFATNYSFDSNTTTQAVEAVAQKYDINIPREIVSWDILSLYISWSTDYVWGSDFLTISQRYWTWTSPAFISSSMSLNHFCDLINSNINSSKIVECLYNGDLKYTLTSKIPWKALDLWNLEINRDPLIVDTTPHIVAKAKKVSYKIENNLISWDNVKVTIWTWIVSYDFSSSFDQDWNLTQLANQITSQTSVNATYDWVLWTIVLESKVPWTDFFVSEFITNSNVIYSTPITQNVEAVAQKEEITLRPISSDETIWINFSWLNYTWPITQSFSWTSFDTIEWFISKLNSLTDISASLTGGTSIEITSKNPWVPFSISNIKITWWAINTYNSTPNQEAIAQIDYIKLPREMYLWDTIAYSISYTGWFSNILKSYTDENYLTWLVDNINSSLAWSYVLAEISNPWLKTIKLTSKIPWTPFSWWNLYITSNLSSLNTQTWVIAVKQETSLTLPRDFAPGDKVTFIIDWNVINQNFDTNNTQTLLWLVSKINSWSTNVEATSLWNVIDFIAKTPWQWFSVNDLKVINSIYPTILQIAEPSTVQTNTITVPNSLTWSELWVNISWDFVSWNNLQDLVDNINTNTLTLWVNASINSNTITIKSNSPTNNFTISDLVQTWSIFTSTTNQSAISETKARLELSVDAIPNDLEQLEIWDCLVNFSTWISTNLSCALGAIIKTTWKDEHEIAGLLKALDLFDTNNWVLSKLWTWTWLIFETSWTQKSSNWIYFSWSISGISLVSNSTPQIWTKQISSITIPRDFVSWDNLTLTISWVTISQSFYLSSSASLSSLVMQLNNLPYVNANLSWSIITLESQNIWESFVVWDILFTNTQTSIQTISSYAWKSQITQITLPYTLDSNDEVIMAIDWVEKTFSWNNLVSDITNSYSWAWFTATATWSNWLAISWNIWENFTINKFEINKNTSSITSIENVIAVRNIEELKIPLNLILELDSNLTLKITWKWDISQNYTWDITETLDILNSKINNSWISSTYTKDWTYVTFTLTWDANWTAFNALVTATWNSVNTINSTPNTESWSQIDTLDLSWRSFNSNDLLTFSLTGSDLDFSPVIISWNTDLNTVYTNLINSINTDINNQAITASQSWWIIELISKVPWTSFGVWKLDIENTLATSSNLIANVVAVKQVDELTLPRDLVSWDTLKINFNTWTYTLTQTFTWSENDTLNEFVSKINTSLSWILEVWVVNKTLTFISSVAWIWFSVDGLKLSNTSVEDLLQENVVAMPQITTISIPELVVWDQVIFTVWSDIVINNFTSSSSDTINSLVSQISSKDTATAFYDSNSWAIILTWKTPWIPFNFASSLINYTNPVSIQDYISPIDQVTQVTAIWTPREDITYFVEINSQKFDYTTSSWDTIDTVISDLTNQINISSTWAKAQVILETLVLTSYSSWIAFSINSWISDTTPPIITVWTSNTLETLKSWDISTGLVSINEKWTIYFVLSWSYTNSSNLDDLINSWSWFLINLDPNSQTGVQIPTWIADWIYNLVASDLGSVDTFSWTTFIPNYSDQTPWFIVIDNTPPIVDITTQSWITINTDTIVITWNSEANSKILSLIISWSWEFVKTTYSNEYTNWSWDFSLTWTLYQNTLNTISVEIQDEAGNIWTHTILINHDNIIPEFINISYPSLTKSSTGNISIETENNILANIFSWATLIASWNTNLNSTISFDVDLTLNYANNYNLQLTDIAWNTASTSIVIVQDSINPFVLNLSPVNWTRVHQNSINITWISESNSQVTITNSWNTYSWTTSSTWSFDILIDLYHNDWFKTQNNISLTIVDEAGNEYSTWFTIIEDSIENSLIIWDYPSLTNSLQLTFTWTYKAWTTLTFTWWSSFEEPLISSTKFIAIVNLKPNQLNEITVSSQDFVLWSTWVTLNITQDNIWPILDITTISGQTTNDLVFNISWTSETQTTLTIIGWSGSISLNTWTWTDFNAIVPLNINSTNNLTITATDLAGNTTTQNFVVNQDSIINFLNLWISWTSYTSLDTFTFTWTTKPWINVDITWWSSDLSIYSWINWNFIATIELNKNTSNNIIVSSTDTTTTTASWWFVIINDSIAPDLIVNQIDSYTNSNSVIITWTSEVWAIIKAWSIESTSTWTFSLQYPLTLNTLNTITLTSTDIAWNISSWVTVSITQDSTPSSFSWITMTQKVLSGSVMTLDYTFDTNEFTNSTIYIWTTSAVKTSLVASESSSWTTFSGSIYGFDSRLSYYYMIESIDNAWNISQTIISKIDSIPVIIPTSITSITIDYLPEIDNWVSNILTWTITVWSWFNLVWEPTPLQVFTFTWWLLDSLFASWTIYWIMVSLESDTNLFTTSSWIVFEFKDILVSPMILGNIKRVFDQAITLWTNSILLLNKPATITFSNNTTATKFAYRKTWTSTWTFGNIWSTICIPNYETSPVCAYRVGNSIIIKTLHFTDFAIITESIIPDPIVVVSSGWWGGWWWGISRDYCPNWDYSGSYYDNSCGENPNKDMISKIEDVKNTISDTNTISEGKKTINQLLRYKLMAELKIKYVKYLGQEIVYIDWFDDSKATLKLSIEIAKSKKINNLTKKRYINIINEFIISKYNLVIAEKKYQTLKNKYNKQVILLKAVLRNLYK